MSGSRKFQARPPIEGKPLSISTDTCFAHAGILPRKLREALAAHPDIPRSVLGRTVIVKTDDFYVLLERLRVAPGKGEGLDQELADDEPRSIGDVLGRLGRGKRVAS